MGPRSWHLLLAISVVWLLYTGLDFAFSPPTVAYTEFRAALAEGRVSEVRVSDSVINGSYKAPEEGGEPKRFTVHRVEDPELFRELSARGVRVVGVPPSSAWHMLLWLLPLFLLGGFALLGRAGQGWKGGFAQVGRSQPRIYAEEEIPVRFDDVAGVDEAKEELQEVLEFLRTPEKFHRVGGKMPRGILLVGPPGTGKTLLARAVAGEAKVPFFSISGSEFVEMFVGVGAARVRDLFERAKKQAPCIIFIDELDALGKARGVGPGSNEEREQTLNQLLVEMDGFDPRAGVVLMAATNLPEILDPALLRAGRFDRHVVVDRPDRTGRLAILRVHARKVPLEDAAHLESIATMTAGMVGADLANVVNEAALQAVRRGREKITLADLEEAVERIVAGLARKSRALSPTEKRRVACHEVGHALVGLALGSGEVKKISILPRGVSALGYTIQLPTEDRYLMTQAELEDRISTLLGGRAAEELIFGELSTGAHDDLRKATALARGMVRAYGMSQSLGPISLDSEPQPMFLGTGSPERGVHSEEVAREIDSEVRRILEARYARATEVLAHHLQALEVAAARLLEREVLSGEELKAILGRHAPAEPTPALPLTA